MQEASSAAADNPEVEAAIQQSLAEESATVLSIGSELSADPPPPPLTAGDARRIFHCVRETTRIRTLRIQNVLLRDDAVLNVFRDCLPMCTSVRTVSLYGAQLENDGLERLLPAFSNTSITRLDLYSNHIQRQRGGDVIRSLLFGNNDILELNLCNNPIRPEGAAGIGQGLFYTGNTTTRLQKLDLSSCEIGNAGLANLMLPTAGDGGMIKNNTLTNLNLTGNGIEGAEGGHHIASLLQRLSALKVLRLDHNPDLGPLGARAMAPGVAGASCLEVLSVRSCWLGNDGVANLVPDGQLNRRLKSLYLEQNNIQQCNVVLALAARCTNLDRLVMERRRGLNPDEQRRLDLLLDRKRLCTAAQALAGSSFSVLFQFVEEQAHCHEHGLSAILVILQNDGDDYFYTALDRTVQK
jgi:Ran GTPase-activating protein (RanGAP) involved in mRNA processing and transport